MDAEDLRRKYSVTEEEVEEWAKSRKDLPKNAFIRTVAYIHGSKGVGSGDESFQLFGITVPRELTLMSDVKPDTIVKVRGYVAAKTRSNPYMGCPTCMKKVGEDKICPKCGQEVEPIEYFWEEWAIGDDSDKALIASFTPTLVGAGLSLEGKYVTLVGILDVTERNGIQTERFSVKKILSDAEVSVPEKPSTPISKPIEKAKPKADTKKEVEALKTVLLAWNPSLLENLVSWHDRNNFSMPLNDMIKAVGARVENDKVYL